ncbi:hypothetical protein LMH87_000078 [Akanthomyces muscarius]|uniref:Nudix hydrolase domain-containing protein n=1 Tax=Akanthomyces muscarius TaxID=2231603 RepID=A0A9W8QG31_AKAMU|nr:hypothetical protein LMH87_000078 [Akanthomyces muscarius]KAJ4154802.1 hypothetical protein LMH87_000078 [Akanthomyces muscarius]
MAHSSQHSVFHHAKLAEFAVSKKSYLEAHPDAPFGYIAASVLVVDLPPRSKPRILLLQRAADDDDPNLWEPPGGACEDDDHSILYGAARELREETGLEAACFMAQAGEPHFYTLDDGKKVCQFNFLAIPELDKTISLDREEHQRFVWATREQVERGRVEEQGIDLKFTRKEVLRTILSGFDWLLENTAPIKMEEGKLMTGKQLM